MLRDAVRQHAYKKAATVRIYVSQRHVITRGARVLNWGYTMTENVGMGDNKVIGLLTDV